MVPCSLIVVGLMLLLPFSTAAEFQAPGRMLYQEVEQNGGHFDIISWSIGYNTDDRYEFEFRNGAMVLAYIANLTSRNLDDWQLFMELSALVEFRDNGNGYYDAGDVVVSVTNLESTAWNSTYTDQEHFHDELNLSRPSILTACTEANVSIEFFSSDNGTEVYGYNIRATEIMANMTIGAHEWSDEADHLALKIDMQSGAHTYLDPEVTFNEIWNRSGQSSFTGVYVGSYPHDGSFKWVIAKVDGSYAYVNSTWARDGLYLSFPRGEIISYLMILGVESRAENSGPYVEVVIGVEGDVPYFAIGTVIAAAIVTGAILLATRSGRRLKA